jgi:hypothetical protein
MNGEERIRDLLRADADSYRPSSMPGQQVAARVAVRRRNRSRLRAGAVAVAACVAGVVAPLVLVSSSPGHRQTVTVSPSQVPSSPPATNLGGLVANVTPPGWAPVANGAAQLSVPGDWFLETPGTTVCGNNDGVVFVGEPASQLPPSQGCQPFSNVVAMFPLSTVPNEFKDERPTLVNGVPVFLGPNDVTLLTYFVPALGEEVMASGPLASQVLGTLTHSPLSVVLAAGGAPTVPTSWQEVSFEGIRFKVPDSWPTRTQGWPWCSTGVTSTGVVLGVFDSASSVIAPPCPAPMATAASQAGHDGVLAAVGPYSPLPSTPARPCFALRHVSVCTSRTSGTAIDLVISPVEGQRVYMEIGLAGNGMVARTILYSLQTTVTTTVPSASTIPAGTAPGTQ